MYDLELMPNKKELLLKAISLTDLTSFVDLGACWGVHGGYSRFMLDNTNIKKAYIIDGTITELTKERCKRYPEIELIEGLFSDMNMIHRVGKVNAAIMFDILLHQVNPDWNDLIEHWAANINYFIIFNQNWEKTVHTVRFVDNDINWFKENVVYVNLEQLEKWYESHEIMNSKYGKPYKDIPDFWQWGITHQDLVNTLNNIGFELVYTKHYGTYYSNQTKPWIVNQGYIFVNKNNKPV